MSDDRRTKTEVFIEAGMALAEAYHTYASLNAEYMVMSCSAKRVREVGRAEAIASVALDAALSVYRAARPATPKAKVRK